MKFSFKVTLAVLFASTVLNLSCKKMDTSVTPGENAIDAAITKQIALDLVRSLGSGISNNDLKPTSNSGTKATNTTQECGVVSTSFTNTSAVSGDTTRTYVGKSIFTQMCNGYFNNNWNVDAYLLADTLKTTETGTGFNNVYNVTLNYDVRALNSFYSNISIDGVTTTSSYTSKVSGNTVTEYHKMETVYGLQKIQAIRNAYNPQYAAGDITFSTKTADKTTGAEVTNAYSGYMQIWANNTVRAHFAQKGGGFKTFVVDLKTGQVTPFIP